MDFIFLIFAVVFYFYTFNFFGVLGFDSRPGLGIFLFTIASRTALGPTQPPIQWVPGVLSQGVKRPVHEADHSLPSRAEVKE
jgi:small neutral amino acid transporter SnatA (MarC family)